MTGTYAPGTRVEIPVWTDQWMRGDRYGVVVRQHQVPEMTVVKLDKSGAERSYVTADLEQVL